MKSLACILLVALSLPSSSEAKKMVTKEAGDSKAVTPAVLNAVDMELARAMRSMRIPGAPAPYFIAYKLTEVDVNDVVASLGAVTDDKERDFVTIEAHVHVGSYDRDNSNFLSQGRESLDGTVTLPLPLEADPKRARRSAWLATDNAYKEAISQWQAKNEAIASGASPDTAKLPSYTKADPIVTKESVSVPSLTSNKEMAARATRLSSLFRDKSHIRDSRVAFTSFLERRWYFNSEGTRAMDTRRVEGVLIEASSQAKDGQELALYFMRYAQTKADLPAEKELKEAAESMSTTLKALIDAPLAENYTGPVLFEAEGAVGVVRHTLAPHLSGTPPPIGVSSNDALLAGKLVGRKGLKVISEFISLVDDPSISQFKKKFLIGGYKFDDEGVAPQKVKVINKGKLNELLMSRTPNSSQTKSNGHARLSIIGDVFRGSPTNLQVVGHKGQSQAALRKKLLTEAKAQGLPYAMVIKQFDDPAITSNTDMSRLALFQVLQSMNPLAPPHATLAFRLYPDGREQLVRGVQLEPLDLRAWRDLLGVGKSLTVKNFLATTDSPFLVRMSGGGSGRVPSAGIESSVITPDLLFEELSIKGSKYGLRAPPAIPAP